MAASSLAAARAALLRLAYSATSSRPLPDSAVLAARAAVRCLAHDAAAAPSSSSASPSAAAAASRVPTRWQEDRAAGAARSPATATVAVPSSSALSASATADSGVTTRGPAHKAAAAAPSPRTFTVAVLPAVIRALTHKAATASSSATSSPTAVLSSKSGLPSILTCGQRQFSTSAWMPQGANKLGSYPQPKTVAYLIHFINGMVLTKEEELMIRKAFNDKFSHFKVSDMINHLESEEFSFEEYCFLLRLIYSKLGPNRELAELVLKEDINLSCSNDEIMENSVLARIETKIDILSKMVKEGTGEILDRVRVSNKTEWGSIDVLGRKLDVTKLEYIKRVIEYFMGM